MPVMLETTMTTLLMTTVMVVDDDVDDDNDDDDDDDNGYFGCKIKKYDHSFCCQNLASTLVFSLPPQRRLSTFFLPTFLRGLRSGRYGRCFQTS